MLINFGMLILVGVAIVPAFILKRDWRLALRVPIQVELNIKVTIGLWVRVLFVMTIGVIIISVGLKTISLRFDQLALVLLVLN
ncbi:hypothetical protein CTM84_12405 [Photobacterium kishitanii]|nr:hypothetical protein CTM84_12405 [Photobacterium kishitanii]